MKIKGMTLVLIAVIGASLFAGCDSNAKPYAEAMSLFNSGYFEEAALAFDTLGDYKDALSQSKKAHEAFYEDVYTRAVVLFEQGSYEQAIEEFAMLNDYKDSKELAEKAKKTIEFSEWFKDFIWNGEIITFTAVTQVQLASNLAEYAGTFQLANTQDFYNIGIAVYDGENEVGIRKSLLNPSTVFISINGDNIVATVNAGTTISVFPETDGVSPDRIVINLLNGVILEMAL